MDIHVLTLFPEMYRPFLRHGLLARAIERTELSLTPWSLRRFTDDSRGQVDDYAYGGEFGMVMKPEPYFRGVEHIRNTRGEGTVLLMDPGGEPFCQEAAKTLSKQTRLIILTGRYEGVDERVRAHLVDEAWSIGPYVTPGGDLPAMVMSSAIVRHLPGAVSNRTSVQRDSYENERLAPPHYTRPQEFRGMEVPDVLLSGDHEQIRQWRRQRARERTARERPELLGDRFPEDT